MKKIFNLMIIALALIFFMGCSKAWMSHDTIYKTNDHMYFSWWGYKNPTPDDLKKSQQEGWWGEEVPYIPHIPAN